MNIEELLAEMGRRKISIPKLAAKIGVSKKTLYSRISGTTDFSQKEISAIAKFFDLDSDKIYQIFFANEVS